MPLTVREIDAERKFCLQLRLDALQAVISPETIDRVLTQHDAHACRERKLSVEVVVWVILVMHLYAGVAIGDLLDKIGHGLRALWPVEPEALPVPSAITYRRYQLGARPIVALFHAVCRPMATPKTRGAFLGGLRLMALDGCVKDVADTPENEATFGRHRTDRGPAAFPQVLTMTLTECGTHGLVDAGCWPCHTSEHLAAQRMLRSVTEEMLVMTDRGLYSAALVTAIRRRGAHVLCRVAKNRQFRRIRTLPDGSHLIELEETEPDGRRSGKRLKLRLIEYTITDPARPGYKECHRLVTSLLDWERFGAEELVCAYHERWEIEISYDEQETHLCLTGQPLRSKKPVGVIQELYGMWVMHYAIRYLMHEAALSVDVDPDRISFTRAVRVIGDAISDMEIAPPERLTEQWARLIRSIAQRRLPPRRNRICPRVVKRKMSKFPLKRDQHFRPPQPKGAFADAVAVI